MVFQCVACYLSFLFSDDTYFLVERSVAEREIFEDYKAEYKRDMNETNKRGCRLTMMASSADFGALPFGFVLPKGKPELKKEIDNV